jgi:hypothetical protein
LGSVTVIVRELQSGGRVSKRGKPFDKGFVYKLLNNRIYLGEAVHKGTSYPGEHQAIIDQDTFEKVREILATNGHVRGAVTRSATPVLLRGLIFTDTGRAMTPAYTKKAAVSIATMSRQTRSAGEERPARRHHCVCRLMWSRPLWCGKSAGWCARRKSLHRP